MVPCDARTIILIDHPRHIEPDSRNLEIKGNHLLLHPLHKRLSLLVTLVSGRRSLAEDYRKNLPNSSPMPGEMAPKNSIIPLYEDKFITQRNNPYLMQTSSTLHHFTTGLCIPSGAAQKMLNFLQHGKEEYCMFRNEGFITREKKLSDTIKKINLPKFQAKPQVVVSAAKESLSACKKRLGQAQHIFDI